MDQDVERKSSNCWVDARPLAQCWLTNMRKNNESAQLRGLFDGDPTIVTLLWPAAPCLADVHWLSLQEQWMFHIDPLIKALAQSPK